MPQCTSNDSSRTKIITEERIDIQRFRKDALNAALHCVDSRDPYKYAVITRDALWQPWGIDWKNRFSEYRTKLSSKKKINFKKVELKLALTLSLFCGNNAEQACELMYVFGHVLTFVPKKFFTRTDDILHACYRVIRYVYVNYSSSDADSKEEREKKRVDRLKEAFDYITNEENGEQDLYAYFFGQKL